MKGGDNKANNQGTNSTDKGHKTSFDEFGGEAYKGMDDVSPRRKIDPMSKFTPQARIDEFLRKPLDKDAIRDGSQLDMQESKRLAREIITGRRGWWFNRWETFKDKVRRQFAFKLKLMKIAGTRRFLYESGPLILFSVFAIYISWQMEDRLDQMKRKVVRVKTLREEETERENQYLQNALEGRASNDFEDKPIGMGSPSNRNQMYSLNVEQDEDEGALIASPFQEYNEREIDPEEMSKLMKQYEDKSKKLIGGYARLGNPVTAPKGAEPSTRLSARDSKTPTPRA